MSNDDAPQPPRGDLASLSRRCTETMLKIVEADTQRTLRKLERTADLAKRDGRAIVVGADLLFKLTPDDVTKLDGFADIVLKLEQARSAARKADAEVEALVEQRMREAIARAGQEPVA